MLTLSCRRPDDPPLDTEAKQVADKAKQEAADAARLLEVC
jgi:hypothetical protein